MSGQSGDFWSLEVLSWCFFWESELPLPKNSVISTVVHCDVHCKLHSATSRCSTAIFLHVSNARVSLDWNLLHGYPRRTSLWILRIYLIFSNLPILGNLYFLVTLQYWFHFILFVCIFSLMFLKMVFLGFLHIRSFPLMLNWPSFTDSVWAGLTCGSPKLYLHSSWPSSLLLYITIVCEYLIILTFEHLLIYFLKN